MKRLFCAFALLLLLSGPGMRAQAGDGTAADYVLGPDDVIEITVANHSDLDKTLTVLPDGKINFPTVGEIKAAGKTPKKLASELQAELEKTLNNVTVSVLVKEIHSRRVRVIGAVKIPGVFDLKRNWRILDVIAVAGGLNTKPVRIAGRIIRGGTQLISLDIPQAIARPDSDANARLEADDLVLFDELDPVRNLVHVMGQVAKPGAYELEPGMTLLSLLTQAGNPTDHAALSKTYVLRGTTKIPLNLRTLWVEGQPDDSVMGFKLLPGDALYVPENEARFAVMGQVARPGFFTIPEKGKITVLDAFNLAGGQTQYGDLTRAGVIRVVGGKPTVMPVNLDTILKKADMTANLTLQAEDILYVPARGPRGFGWQDVLAPLSALNFLGFRIWR